MTSTPRGPRKPEWAKAANLETTFPQSDLRNAVGRSLTGRPRR